jgi:hypothetical protein
MEILLLGAILIVLVFCAYKLYHIDQNAYWLHENLNDLFYEWQKLHGINQGVRDAERKSRVREALEEILPGESLEDKLG